ncbi:nucleoid-associated protein [Pseudoalteromonas sp. SG43-1]|uniref:nucleoid-associated protein n=1 Tax=Pseudoalteromonas sp. SG43-1 TaxID=2760971 RepID=UPI001603F936|nr:nucleoid-associated protein [Pseudoalteromonas sp. SG43-1]MBB1452333.1 nucleoid-associated protein [Pseudoalteromonas sp. SG43-1]
MALIKIKIDKIMIHQVHQREASETRIKPTRSNEFIKFDKEAMETFESRFINAVGSNSKAVEMDIVNQDKSDLPSIIDKLSTANDKDFKDLSYDVAERLTFAQQRKSIPGGIIVVFRGTFGGIPAKTFIGLMKAEVYSAYEKKMNKLTQEITLRLVHEALLTPATKLYKTAVFMLTKPNETKSLKEKWDVLVSDSQISQTDGKAAAKYFYSTFLGCGYPESSARTTKEFFEATAKFLNQLDITEEKRNDLRNALVSYLKYENTDIINPKDFANRYFELEDRDTFSDYLEDIGLPTNSFTKDIRHIESKLKTRKLSFSKNVKITAPSDVFKNYISIESIKKDSNEMSVNWTKVIIKDKIISQE